MDLEQFFSQHSGSFPRAVRSRHCSQELFEQVRELIYQGLKVFPVGLAAKLDGDPDRLIAGATDDVHLLEELSTATLPLWGYRLALGPSGLCVLVLDGAVGRASFAALVPDLDGCLTLQARRGDAVYAFFRQPAGARVIGSARKLALGVSIFGHDAGFDLPPTGGAVWVNPGAEIETLPYALRELLASDPPDVPPGRAIPVSKPSFRPVPCRPAVRFPQPNQVGLRKGHPVCNQAGWRRGGYRICRQR
jgi:hypothetical protein